MDKKEVLEFIKAHSICHLATVADGAPRVRAMGLYRVDEDGIIIQTWKDKDLGQQLDRNPQVEMCFNDYKANVQVRVRGEVEPFGDAAELEQVGVVRPSLKKFIESGHRLVLYRLKKGRAHIWTMAQNFDPKTFVEL
ncbi:pyridoxamine 5'-phosphate oxidase family protein [Chloroflexota bacterium]